MRRVPWPWLWMTVALAAFPSRADAYVDPGSGSLLLQAITAFFLAALYPVQRLISRWRQRKLSRTSRDHQ